MAQYVTNSCDKTNHKKRILTRDSTVSKPQGILQAILPGAKVDNVGKLKVNVRTLGETLVLNIGGTTFETYKATLRNQPDMPLADDTFLQRYYRKDKGDYFFDRDPDMFRAILNFLRTGELHLPSHVCGPAARIELDFWGIGDDVIERCCWTDYNAWNATLNALQQLEKDRKGSVLDSEGSDQDTNPSCYNIRRTKLLEILNAPTSSKSARIYGWVSLFFVALSIFSFMAETHPSLAYHKYVDGKGTLTGNEGNYSQNAHHKLVNVTQETINITSGTSQRKVLTTHPALEIIDYICLAFFTTELILRLILTRRRIRFITSAMGIIDLLAIFPDFVAIVIYLAKPQIYYEGSVDFIAILKISRVLRIFRLIRHVPGLWILVYTLKASFKELLLMSAFLLVGMLFFSSLIYFVEDHSVFTSIPHGFWWAIITMTTVGYGDMYPSTNLGYLIGSFTALSGLLMIGFSVPVLVNNFIMYYKHVQFALEEEETKKRHKEIERSRKKKAGLFGMMGRSNNGKDNNVINPESIPLQNTSGENNV